MKNYTLSKIAKWAAFNLPITGAIVVGLLLNNPIAEVGIILRWINFILIVLATCVYCSKSGPSDKEWYKRMKRSVPVWVSLPLDIGTALFLGWHGCIATAVIVIIEPLFEGVIFDKAQQMRDSDAQNK